MQDEANLKNLPDMRPFLRPDSQRKSFRRWRSILYALTTCCKFVDLEQELRPHLRPAHIQTLR